MNFRTVGVTACLIGCLAISAPALAGPISGVSKNDSSQSYELDSGGFANGVDAFSDSSETWGNIPTDLDGADYVRTGKSDNSNSDLEVTVDFDSDGTLLVFHSDGIGNPDWLSSNFSDTGGDLDLVGATSGPYSVYGQELTAGSNFTLLDNDPETTNSGLMYGIAGFADTGGENGGGQEVPLPPTILLLMAGLVAMVGSRKAVAR